MSDIPTPPPGDDEDPHEVEEEIVDVAEAEGDDEAGEPDGGSGGGPDDGQEITQRPPQEVRRQSPTSRRFERLSNENRDLKNRVADFEKQLASLVQQQRQSSPAEIAAQERAEAEAVSMMAPAEVARYYSQRSEQRIQTELNQTRQMLWDQNDQGQYDTLVAQNPAYRRYADRVEELRRQAPGVSRRILLATAIGMRALDGEPGARTRAANRNAEQSRQQMARPSNGRGDVAAPTTRTAGNRWDRLRNVQI
jgi:hypothetical protein